MLLDIEDPGLSKQKFGKKTRLARMHQLALSSTYTQAYIMRAGKRKQIE